MTLADLLTRRAELLTKCTAVDRAASLAREHGKPLDLLTRSGFEAHVELRVVEREIAKLREPRR